MSARKLIWGISGFITTAQAYSIFQYADRTSAAAAYEMAFAFLMGAGAAMCFCIGLLADDGRVEKKHTPPQP